LSSTRLTKCILTKQTVFIRVKIKGVHHLCVFISRETNRSMSGTLTAQLVTMAAALEAGPAVYVTASKTAPASLPTPTVAETVAFGGGPSGGLSNLGPSVAMNPEPAVQQLLLAEQAKRRLEVTVRLLTAQLNSQSLRRANAVA
jgi:hypothetical protein